MLSANARTCQTYARAGDRLSAPLLIELHASSRLQSLRDALRARAPLRSQLDDLNHRLLAGDAAADERAAIAPVAATLTARWSAHERRVRVPPPAASAVLLEATGVDARDRADDDENEARGLLAELFNDDREPNQAAFADRVGFWLNALNAAVDRLSFATRPATDADEWRERLEVCYRSFCVQMIKFICARQEVVDWHAGAKPSIAALLNEGRRLADSGRMELKTHEALQRLDTVVDLSSKVCAPCDGDNARDTMFYSAVERVDRRGARCSK